MNGVVKFGLNIMKKEEPLKRNQPNPSQAVSFLDAESSEDESLPQAKPGRAGGNIAYVNRMLVASNARQSLKTQKKMEDSDPTCSQYDECFDSIQSQKTETISHLSQAASKDNNSSVYIQEIMKRHQRRKLDQERAYQRKILAEKEAEDAAFGDKEKFVTAAYKRKLQELEDLEKMEREEERINQLRRQGNTMANFHSSLLTSNVSAGHATNSTSNRAASTSPVQKEEEEEEERREQASHEEPGPEELHQRRQAQKARATEHVMQFLTEEKESKAVEEKEALEERLRRQVKARNTAASIAEAKERALARKQARGF